MATVIFAALGAAFGSGFGGTLLGLSGAVIGRAVGATVGRAIDQRLMGLGSEAVEVGRVDRFRVMGASEGTAITKTWGRMRLPGQVIWTSDFKETSSRSGGGGKGAPRPRFVQIGYTVSLAVALCEGEILGIGRIWADGAEIEPSSLDIRTYNGSADQMPDPAIEAYLGAGNAPAYRNTAYVVIEDMDLSVFGNRVPQLSFEVIRQAQVSAPESVAGFSDIIRAVALIPGTGEYALATDKVSVATTFFNSQPVNTNSRAGISNFAASFDQLKRELPKCESVSLVVSWFGSDLRCAECRIQPKVEQTEKDARKMPWRAGGITRLQAEIVPQLEGRSVYGGTPTDQSVIQAIQAATAADRKVMFYPFILMDQLSGNARPDPYGNSAEQPSLPWRGRITLSKAPGQAASPDLTTVASTEVAAFFGSVQPGHFIVQDGQISYSGPNEWTYRRFILHYAHLCSLAGGVDAFCIGSEMRGLTQIRGADHIFPAVSALRQLAADVRGILGSSVKISYAADWSEYFGYHRDGNIYFHLDPLWSDSNIDFIGIDNYMPLSDWRDQDGHADSHWKSNANIEYLKANICGGEGFDWYYDGKERRDAQLRSAIEDDAYDEPWVFRYKDLPSWWGQLHYNRLNGVRSNQSTAWEPRSKPIWFTEYGCAAIDKGTNEPNKFLDPKSSESSLPCYSNGNRDDYLQFQYYRAMHEYWADPEKNPVSPEYGATMLDVNRLFAWAWDARPFPEFPGSMELWSDGVNYHRGHWLNGRSTSVPLDNLVREICESSELSSIDVRDLNGIVFGYTVEQVGSARSALQPLSVAFGFDAIETSGVLRFISRGLTKANPLESNSMALNQDYSSALEKTRLGDSDTFGRSRLVYISSDGDFSAKVAEATFADEALPTISQSEFSLSMTSPQAKSIVERWLAEARAARDVLKLRLPASACEVDVGSVLQFVGVNYRVDRVEIDECRMIEAVRIEASHHDLRDTEAQSTSWKGYAAPSSVFPVWMDLPLLRGSESPSAPHLSLTAKPWPGQIAIWDSDQDEGYSLLSIAERRSTMGTTLTSLASARPGLMDRGPALVVKLDSGTLSSADFTTLLNGSNTMAIGDGSQDNWEIFQFQAATLVAQDTYELSMRLRGQVGTDCLMPSEWPIGSLVVLLNAAVGQIPLQSSFRGLVRNYRIGAAAHGYDDADVTHHVLGFKGNGLRPFNVAHLVSQKATNGDYRYTWIRRTRIDGDNWDSYEVPLGEAQERYHISVKSSSGLVLRTEIASVSTYTYTAIDQVSDGASLPFAIEIAQISDSYGLGAVARIDVLA